MSYTEVSLLKHEETPSQRCLPYTDLFTKDSGESRGKPFAIDTLTDLKEQEALLMVDLLYMMRGSEGSYARYVSTFSHEDTTQRIMGPIYKTSKNLYVSHKEICKRILRNATVYYALSSFVEEYDSLRYGKTVQALCFQVKLCLSQYDLLLAKVAAQLKTNPKYNFQAMEHDFKVGISSEIEALYKVTTQIHEGNVKRSSITVRRGMRFDNMKHAISDAPLFAMSDTSCNKYINGGIVLGMIYELIEQTKSDARVCNFLTNLYEKISQPMIHMLNEWLNLGQVDDPQGEFIISQNDDMPFGETHEFYWKNRYAFKAESLPVQFAGSNLQHKLISTGLYLNILASWGVDLHSLGGEVKIESLFEDSISFKVDDAFKRASSILLTLLFDGDSSLKVILQQLVKQLMVRDSDILNQVFSRTMSQFQKSRPKFSVTSLQNTFNMVVAKDTISGFKMSEFLTPVLRSESLMSSLKHILNSKANNWEQIFHDGDMSKINHMVQSISEQHQQNETGVRDSDRPIDYFDFEVEIPFPMNIFFTKVHVSEAQLLFRHFATLQFVEKTQVDTVAEIHKHINWRFRFSDARIIKWVCEVRQLHFKMRQCVLILGTHFSHYVIGFHWQKLESKLNSTVDIDELQTSIKTFFGQAMQYSFLTNLTLFESYTQLLETMLEYDKFLMSLRKTLVSLDASLFEQNRALLRDGAEFDPEKASKRFGRAQEYLALIDAAFRHNLTQFNKALEYYGNKGTQSFLELHKILDQIMYHPEGLY